MYGNGHKYLIKEFYDSIKNGTDVPVCIESAIFDQKVVEAAYKSCEEKAYVAVK